MSIRSPYTSPAAQRKTAPAPAYRAHARSDTPISLLHAGGNLSGLSQCSDHTAIGTSQVRVLSYPHLERLLLSRLAGISTVHSVWLISHRCRADEYPPP